MSATRAVSAILELCRSQLGDVELVSVDTVSWASATFDGVRSTIAFTTTHSDPSAFLRDLPDADIAVGNGFVADIRVVSCDRQFETWRLALEALIIDLAGA